MNMVNLLLSIVRKVFDQMISRSRKGGLLEAVVIFSRVPPKTRVQFADVLSATDNILLK